MFISSDCDTLVSLCNGNLYSRALVIHVHFSQLMIFSEISNFLCKSSYELFPNLFATSLINEAHCVNVWIPLCKCLDLVSAAISGSIFIHLNNMRHGFMSNQVLLCRILQFFFFFFFGCHNFFVNITCRPQACRMRLHITDLLCLFHLLKGAIQKNANTKSINQRDAEKAVSR